MDKKKVSAKSLLENRMAVGYKNNGKNKLIVAPASNIKQVKKTIADTVFTCQSL